MAKIIYESIWIDGRWYFWLGKLTLSDSFPHSKAADVSFSSCFPVFLLFVFLKEEMSFRAERKSWKQKPTKIPTAAWMFRPNNPTKIYKNIQLKFHSLQPQPTATLEGQSAYSNLDANTLDDESLGFQPPLKQWVDLYNHHCWTLSVLIIEIGEKPIIFDGGGSPGIN